MITEKELHEILAKKYIDAYRDSLFYKSGYDSAVELMETYIKEMGEHDFIERIKEVFDAHFDIWLKYRQEIQKSREVNAYYIKVTKYYLIEDGYTDALHAVIEHFMYDV